MQVIFNIFIFFFGLIIGSFLNCILYRLQQGESFLKGRSYCPHCRHTLAWIDLIPVFSFLFLYGRCRYCHKKISIQYPLVEVAIGLVFLLIFNFQPPVFSFKNTIALCFSFYVWSSLVVIFIYDLKHYLIPDKILFPAIAVAVVYNIFFDIHWLLFNALWAALAAAGFFLLIFLISRGKWLGFGDVKLVILLGLVLGFPDIIVGLFLSFFFGSIIGLVLVGFGMVAGRTLSISMKSEIPFAPFLIFGTFLAMLFGGQIIQFYSSFFLF